MSVMESEPDTEPAMRRYAHHFPCWHHALALSPKGDWVTFADASRVINEALGLCQILADEGRIDGILRREIHLLRCRAGLGPDPQGEEGA